MGNPKKAKGFFLYDGNKKWFDFSHVYSGHGYGYYNPVLQSRMKSATNASTPFGNATLPSNASAVLKVKRLFERRNPWLEGYGMLALSPIELAFLWRSWGPVLHKEPIDFDALLDSSASNPGPDNKNVHVYTDNYVVFNGLGPSKATTKMFRVLYLNAWFPYALRSEEVAGFEAVLVGGHHPFGADKTKLLFVRRGSEQLLQDPVPAPFSTPCPWSLEMYRQGLLYHHRKEREAEPRRLGLHLQNALDKLRRRGFLSAVEGTERHYRLSVGSNLFCRADRSPEWRGRLFFPKLSFLGREPFLYVGLSLTLGLDELKHRLRALESLLGSGP